MDVDLTEREGGEILKLMVLFQIFACSSFHILYLTLISQHIPFKKTVNGEKGSKYGVVNFFTLWFLSGKQPSVLLIIHDVSNQEVGLH